MTSYHGVTTGIKEKQIGVVFKDIAKNAGDLGFYFQPGQIQQLASAATFLWSSAVQALCRADRPATRYTLRRNTASMMKI